MTNPVDSSALPPDDDTGREDGGSESEIPYSALPDGLLVDFRSVPVDPDEWLPGLRGLVLKGEFTMLAADGGAGKSTTVAGWIAALSQADVKVLYLAERSLKGTRKKLQAAEANLDNVITFPPVRRRAQGFVDQSGDAGTPRPALRSKGVSLTPFSSMAARIGRPRVVLDPVNHFLRMSVNRCGLTHNPRPPPPQQERQGRPDTTTYGWSWLREQAGARPRARPVSSRS